MIRSLALFALAIAGPATAQSPPAPTPPPYAWATFDAHGLTASGASGLADRARGRQLTIEDPARIASISKLVVAIGVMRLVEQGRLDLDRDVSDYLGWRLRNPAFPDRPITLRLLLSHRSSLKDDIEYWAIPLGATLERTLANPIAFDPAHAPGSYFRYANLGFPVIASVLEKATGERFDRLMARLVLRPLGLSACFNWSQCGEGAIERAVVLTRPDGTVIRDDLGGRPPACLVLAPNGCDLATYRIGDNGALFSPQGGLRASVHDLTIVGRMLMAGGRHNGRRFLRQASVTMLATPLWTYDGANGANEDGFYCAYGMAVQRLPIAQAGCHDDLFGGGRAAWGHAGDAYGVRSGLWIDPVRHTGIAFISTANGDDPPRGAHSAYRRIEERLAAHLRP
ncbi:serine hydrolase domain-containing protein [Allosphingosinicella sp.]|uniref:serine hydrolase domain-containing protein n=1 Tax=Allosphingosinicella sp. TaxID=2823234 RepID=UPI003784459D